MWQEDPWLEQWPIRVQRLNTARMAELTGALPFEIRLEPSAYVDQPAPFDSVLDDAMHRGYAATWFSLAVALIILYILLGVKTAQGLRRKMD